MKAHDGDLMKMKVVSMDLSKSYQVGCNKHLLGADYALMCSIWLGRSMRCWKR